MSSKTGIIIPARSRSRRFHRKHERPLAGTTLMQFLVNRLRGLDLPINITLPFESNYLSEVDGARKMQIIDLDENDVLGRVLATASMEKFDRFVLVWGDSPLMCPDLVGNLLDISDRGYDLVRNLGPSGFKVQVVRTEWARRWAQWIEDSREFLFTLPPTPNMKSIMLNTTWTKFSVDKPGDLDFVNWLVKEVGEDATAGEYIGAAHGYHPYYGSGDPTGHTPLDSGPEAGPRG